MQTQVRLILPIFVFAIIGADARSTPADACAETKCGRNAICKANGETAECLCPEKYVDDGHQGCFPEQCRGICGDNADCEVKEEKVQCSCKADFTGNPYEACRKISTRTKKPGDSCVESDDCLDDEMCVEKQCRQACKVRNVCGKNAECRGHGHEPICECPFEYKGDPNKECVYVH